MPHPATHRARCQTFVVVVAAAAATLTAPAGAAAARCGTVGACRAALAWRTSHDAHAIAWQKHRAEKAEAELRATRLNDTNPVGAGIRLAVATCHAYRGTHCPTAGGMADHCRFESGCTWPGASNWFSACGAGDHNCSSSAQGTEQWETATWAASPFASLPILGVPEQLEATAWLVNNDGGWREWAACHTPSGASCRS